MTQCVEFMKEELFPHMIAYQRDPAHAIRTACKEPMERAVRFERIFKMLFSKDHALLKDLRYSDLWAGKVLEWQRRVIEDRGFMGGDVKDIIRTFVFAPQRFESFCTPLFNLLIVIPAIFKMMKMIVEEWRDVKQAKRARHALHLMDGQFILDLGLIADYGSVLVGLAEEF